MTARWPALAATILAAAVLAGCGSAKNTATTASTSKPKKAPVIQPTPAGSPTACSSYGATWLKAYNRTALLQGSPIRMVSACCGPATKAGRHHCFLKVTLIGTKTLGCETVDLGHDGTPATVGRHENCALHR
jgi:hypothetical protein